MRICFFARILPVHSIGGMQDHAMALAEGIARKGHDVTVITTRHPEGTETESKGNLHIYYLSGTEPGKVTRAWATESIKKFEELQRKKPFDMIHSQSFAGLPILENKVNLKRNVPFCITLHGFVIDEINTVVNVNLFSGNVPEMLKACLRILYYSYVHLSSHVFCIPKADGVIATSNEQRALILKHFSVNEKKVFTVFNGIDTRLFSPGAPKNGLGKYGFDPKKKIILAVARLEKEKGIQEIICALPDITKTARDAKLVVAGDGTFRDELAKLVEARQLGGCVTFTGALPPKKLSSLFNGCDVFVNPTLRQNGYDLTILEAMACGKPVVASDIGSNPTAISNGRDGSLVPIKDRHALANAVARILTDGRFSKKLGANARKKTLRQFQTGQMVDGTIRTYRNIIAATRDKYKKNIADN